MHRTLLYRRIFVGQSDDQGFSRSHIVNPAQCPDRTTSHFSRRTVAHQFLQDTHGLNAHGPQTGGGPTLNEQTRIVQKAGQSFRIGFVPRNLSPQRVFDFGRALFSHSINAAQDIRLCQLRRRTAHFVPAAGVDNQQAAIRIFKDISRVKVGMIAGKKIRVFRFVRRPVRNHFVLNDFVQIEVAGKHLLIMLAAEQGVTSADKTARRGGSLMIEHRHDITGHRMSENGIVLLAVNSAVDRVNQSVTSTGFRKLKECAAKKSLAIIQKRHIDGIVHAANQHRFHLRSVRLCSKDV